MNGPPVAMPGLANEMEIEVKVASDNQTCELDLLAPQAEDSLPSSSLMAEGIVAETMQPMDVDLDYLDSDAAVMADATCNAAMAAESPGQDAGAMVMADEASIDAVAADPPGQKPLSSAEPAAPLSQPAVAESSSVCLPTAAELLSSALGAPPAQASDGQVPDINICLGMMLHLARQVRRPRTYCGYSMFLVFAVMKRYRVFCWEGATRVDLVQVFAPWADDICTLETRADCVSCKYDCSPISGLVTCTPISATCTLAEVNHYVAVLPLGTQIGGGGGSGVDLDSRGSGSYIERFYLALGQVVQFTVADGDCGLDVMCIMCGMNRTAEKRAELREQLSTFLLEHAEDERLQRALSCCQETHANPISIPQKMDVKKRAPDEVVGLGAGSFGGGLGQDITDEVLDAVRWASNFQHASSETMRCIVARLPKWCISEQLQKYKNRSDEAKGTEDALLQHVPVKKSFKKAARQYCSTTLSSRLAAANKFLTFLRNEGVDVNVKRVVLPYGSFAKYIGTSDELQRICSTATSKQSYRKWLLRAISIRGCESLLATTTTRSIARSDHKARYVRDAMRKKKPGSYGLHRKKAAIVREHLFEWFSILRHSLDCKVMTRFPPKLVELKAKSLVEEYVAACLKEGIEPNPPMITSHWLKDWQTEFRVSFRRPNRKFKVPKHVLDSRLRIFWANLARVRALAQGVLGYDLTVVNMDQSPFHMNESGALF